MCALQMLKVFLTEGIPIPPGNGKDGNPMRFSLPRLFRKGSLQKTIGGEMVMESRLGA
jgi:hypothetical protein